MLEPTRPRKLKTQASKSPHECPGGFEVEPNSGRAHRYAAGSNSPIGTAV
jgi:hypothetical protein